jgi:hypothetical protein
VNIFPLNETYAFVDGGYLYSRMNELSKAVYGREWDLSFPNIKKELGTLKLFFYDGLASDPDIEEAGNHSRQEVYKEIQALPGCHVCLGRLKRPSSPKKAPRQKMVDVLLAVDSLSHVFRGNCKHVILIAGDADFAPIAEALNDFGAFVTLYAFSRHVAPELLSVVDDFKEKSFRDIQVWYKQPPHLVQFEHHVGGHGTWVYLEKGRIEAFKSGNNFTVNLREVHQCVTSKDWDTLRKATMLEFGIELPENPVYEGS